MEKPVNVSYGETARVVRLSTIRHITNYNTDQYQNWDELWLCLALKQQPDRTLK